MGESRESNESAGLLGGGRDEGSDRVEEVMHDVLNNITLLLSLKIRAVNQ